MSSTYGHTSLAKGMYAAEQAALRDRYDRMCKRILSERIVLGWILHECLDEFKDTDPKRIASDFIEGTPELGTVPVHADDAAASLVEGMNSEDSSLAEETVWYDIRFRALVPGTDARIGMIVNVETQGAFDTGYPLLKRAMYYCGRMISSQYGRVFAKSHYELLQKVCSIWICPSPPVDMRNTITRFSMAEEALVGFAKWNPAEYDSVDIVFVCPDGDRQKKGDGLLRLLGTLLASERSVDERKAIITDEFDIPMSKQLSDEVDEVGSWLSKSIEDRAFEWGIERGIEQGIERGLEQGFEQGIEQGIEQGLAQGIEQGLEQGLEQGIERGRKLGMELGITRDREMLTRLATKLSEQGREGELTQALLDPSTLDALLAEFGIEPSHASQT